MINRWLRAAGQFREPFELSLGVVSRLGDYALFVSHPDFISSGVLGPVKCLVCLA
jgi:hypothetical protein